jgi:hypothetical protein
MSLEPWLLAAAQMLMSVILGVVGWFLKQQISQADRRMNALEARGDKTADELHEFCEERLRQARDCALQFATSGELGRLIADNTIQYRALSDKIEVGNSELHQRVTELAKEVREMKGRMEGNP